MEHQYGTDGLAPVGGEDLGFGATVRGFVEGQRLFDRYVLNKILGRGGMGVVWLAMDERLERPVAMKFLPELIKLDTAALDELKRETRRSLELTHANIVRIYDFVDDATAAAISMEYVDGATLSAWRVQQPNKVFEVGQIREWVLQMLEALDYAHRKAKLVHRDLKPANLMVTSEGELKVADFGIARSISDSVSRVTMQQGSSGTLAYMSPQQAMGQNPTVTDDIYAFGATLFELLTSKPPFHRGDLMSQLREVVPPSIAERRAEMEIVGEPIPPEWEQTIAACLAKDAAARPQRMSEVGERLGLMVAKPTTRNTQPAVAAATVKAAPSSAGSPKKLPIPLIAGMVAGVIVLGVLGWYFGVERPAEQEKLRLAELAQQEAIQKEKDLEAKSEADAAEKVRLEAEAKKAADEAEALRTAQEKAKADADAKAAADAAIAKAAADQKAADEAIAAKAAADQKTADDAAKAAADQKAAADNAAKLAAAQKAADDAAKALAEQKAAGGGGAASSDDDSSSHGGAQFDGNSMLLSCLTALPNGVIIYHPERFAALYAGKVMEVDGTVSRINTKEHLVVFNGGGIYPNNWDLQLAMGDHNFTAGRTYHVEFRLNTMNNAPFAGYSFRGRVMSSSSER